MMNIPVSMTTTTPTKVIRHNNICEELTDLYSRKNADYGDSFGKSYDEYGLLMSCLRLEDKLNRMKSLAKRPAQVRDESLRDTLMDIANYAIMTIIEITMREEGAAQ